MRRTGGVDESCVELLGEERVGHVPEELLQQSRHIVDAVLLIQRDVNATVKFLTQLKDKKKRWPRRERGRGLRNIL